MFIEILYHSFHLITFYYIKINLFINVYDNFHNKFD